MKNIFLYCALFFAISIHAYSDPSPDADKTGSISGKVLDANLKEPLPYVNVIIKDSVGKTLTGGMTLDDGSFKIEKVEEGNIVVSIQYIGYKTYNKNVIIGKGSFNIDLGNIFLDEEAEGLDEVTVDRKSVV